MEISLFGAIVQVPDVLFLRREYRGKIAFKEKIIPQLQRINPTISKHHLNYPVCNMGLQYVLSAIHAPIPIVEKPYIVANVIYSFVRRWNREVIQEIFSRNTNT